MDINKVYVGMKKDSIESLIPFHWINLNENRNKLLLYEVHKGLYKELIKETYYRTDEIFIDELVPFKRILDFSRNLVLSREKIIKLYH